MNITILPEAVNDADTISHLIDTCFGPDRKERTVYQFRDGVAPYTDLCLVARNDGGRLCGSLRFWPVMMPDQTILPLFGPLAVQPDLQGQGIGRKLIQAGHDLVAEHNFPAILIIGRPDYYKPFGYCEKLVENLNLPGPVAPLTFMGKEIEADSLSHLHGDIHPAK
ncbi:MAG: N-acetyltransferase [Alphaproteobacteria bacterium]|nr:N-acetyltransferase [Alphaproteobacteria bacterium]